ncbi:MAG: hypothetical protein P1V20_17780 [Verrucomicrobiales bacterium]|nr:hypothetical protein [Verrucomicrobiales bacterium]
MTPSYHQTSALAVPDDHPILGLDAMRPMILHHPRSDFDETNLLKLLRGSCTLTLDEKLKILGRISRMNQDQVDNLMQLLVNEHEKFEFIADEFPEDFAELVEERMSEIGEAVQKRALMNN